MKVLEFRNINDLNDHLSHCRGNLEVIPIARMFENPQTSRLTNTLTYILIDKNNNKV